MRTEIYKKVQTREESRGGTGGGSRKMYIPLGILQEFPMCHRVEMLNFHALSLVAATDVYAKVSQ